MVRQSDGTITSRLVKLDRPILRIPTLAIHLDRQEKFEFNKETQLFPIVGLVSAEINKPPANPDNTTTSEPSLTSVGDNEGEGVSPAEKEQREEDEMEDDEKPFAPLAAITERHHPAIVKIIAEETGVKSEDVLDFEMLLYDTQAGSLGGLNEEFIFSARLDNLVCCT